MKFMTYNIRLAIQEGVEAVADVISSAAPDIVAIQEVGRHWTMGPEGDTAAELAATLGMSHIFVPCIQERRAQYGHALLCRFPIQVRANLELPRASDEPRRALFSEIRTTHGRLQIVSTHLSHIADRKDQWPFLLDEIQVLYDENDLVFVMGDLNEDSHATEIQEMSDQFADADPSSTLTFPSTDPRVRLDYLFASHGTWKDTRVIENASVSDHFPVVSTWQI